MGLKKGIQPMFQRGKWRILRGDRVMITTGKDKGQLGTVSKVIRHPQIPRVIVEGRNLVRSSVGLSYGAILTCSLCYAAQHDHCRMR